MQNNNQSLNTRNTSFFRALEKIDRVITASQYIHLILVEDVSIYIPPNKMQDYGLNNN